LPDRGVRTLKTHERQPHRIPADPSSDAPPGPATNEYNELARRLLDNLQRNRPNRPWIQPDAGSIPLSKRTDIHTGLTNVKIALTKIIQDADKRGGRLK